MTKDDIDVNWDRAIERDRFHTSAATPSSSHLPINSQGIKTGALWTIL